MRRLADIPRLRERLKIYLTILTWSDGARKYLRKVDILEESGSLLNYYYNYHYLNSLKYKLIILFCLLIVTEIKDPKCIQHFTTIFSWVLAIGLIDTIYYLFILYLILIFSGNYMNGGTNKGQAHGIKLSGLVKLNIILFFSL